MQDINVYITSDEDIAEARKIFNGKSAVYELRATHDVVGAPGLLTLRDGQKPNRGVEAAVIDLLVEHDSRNDFFGIKTPEGETNDVINYLEEEPGIFRKSAYFTQVSSIEIIADTTLIGKIHSLQKREQLWNEFAEAKNLDVETRHAAEMAHKALVNASVHPNFDEGVGLNIFPLKNTPQLYTNILCSRDENPMIDHEDPQEILDRRERMAVLFDMLKILDKKDPHFKEDAYVLSDASIIKASQGGTFLAIKDSEIETAAPETAKRYEEMTLKLG